MPGCNPCKPRECYPAGSCCAPPTPHELTGYYSRHHGKIVFDQVKGACYCPGDCQCAHWGMEGRRACPRACDPCAVVDACPEDPCCPRPCCKSRGQGQGQGQSSKGCCPQKSCCPSQQQQRNQQQQGGSCCSPCCEPPSCCRPKSSPAGSCPQPDCCPPRHKACCIKTCWKPCCCDPCCNPAPAKSEPPQTKQMTKVCCDPCNDPCCGPYCPPPRKPVCYPPVNCCEPDPCMRTRERVCFYPCPEPPQPKYCPCGSPNPCECDLAARRKRNIRNNEPCCRRCGRKVYHAEKIVAAGGAFHSCCFSCYCCHKPLEFVGLYENQGEIYCKHCYNRFFGIQGYGYGWTLESPI